MLLAVSVSRRARGADPTPPGDVPPTDESGTDTIDVEVSGRERSPVEGGRDPSALPFVLRGERLRSPGVSLPELLTRVPGVEPLRTGGSGDLATVRVRSASSAQTPVYLAGVRLNDELTGVVDLSALPVWLLDRVEVYRGAAPAGVGEPGLGGAVLLEPELPDGERVFARLTAGSFGYGEAAVATAVGRPEAAVLVAGRRQSEVGDYTYRDDGGTRFDPSDDFTTTRQHAAVETHDAWAIARLRWSGPARGSLVVFANAFARSAELPGLLVLPATQAQATVERLAAGASARLACPGADLALRCTLGVEFGVLASRYRLEDPGRELGLGAPRVDDLALRMSPRLSAAVSPVDALDVAVGLRIEPVRLEADDLRAERRSLSVDLAARLRPLPPLELSAAGTVGCDATRATRARVEEDRPCTSPTATARVAARLQVASEPRGEAVLDAAAARDVASGAPGGAGALRGELAVVLGGGRYVRIPTLAELHGTGASIRGNPELSPETGVAVDLGVVASIRGAWVDCWAQVAGYARFARDLIAYRRSSQGVLRPYNDDSARVVGVEVAAGATFFDALQLELVATAIDARDTSEGAATEGFVLPLEPRLRLAPALEVRVPLPSAGRDQLRVRASYAHRGERTADPAGLVVLPAEGDLDVEVAVALLDQSFALRARLENALAQRSFDLVGYPLPGRAVHGGLEMTW